MTDLEFAQDSEEAIRDGLNTLVALIRGRRVAVLTGAGCSTESGIPDYRGEETRKRARNPIKYQGFIGAPEIRQRYWARAMIGWPRFRASEPNDAHFALAELEARGALSGLITQNVDRLHHKAGSKRVVELHGALAEVVCLSCGALEDRDALQSRLLANNPGFANGLSQIPELAPDGDAEVERYAGFRVPTCLQCAGALKPRVVFFGESVPQDVVASAFQILAEAEVLLVVGSSLAVYSGYRFVRQAAKEEKPVALVNLGSSRADPSAVVRIAGPCGSVLPRLVQLLGD